MTGMPEGIITDKDLAAAIDRKNATLKNMIAINQLVGKFLRRASSMEHGKVRRDYGDMSQELRAVFLKELEAL